MAYLASSNLCAMASDAPTYRIKVISAGAGSGKTYRLTQELVSAIRAGVRPEGVIATTFTQKAAGELQERVRQKLLEEGLVAAAHDLSHALIGTVHSLGVRLLRRFAYEVGVSPQVDIIAEEDHQLLFNQALAAILLPQRVEAIEAHHRRLGLGSLTGSGSDWRHSVRTITEAARANRMGAEVLEQSKQQTIESLLALFPAPMSQEAAAQWEASLANTIAQTCAALRHSEDETVKTRKYIEQLEQVIRRLARGEELEWQVYAQLLRAQVSKKSQEVVVPLVAQLEQHERHPQLRHDLAQYIAHLYDLAQDAIAEYQRYKKQRGLIDYTDMEVLVDRLLDMPQVQAVLAAQLDLLIVDEFQDTSPIQLNIFYKLSKLAKQSVWVGDPKQSIYGFRGADPALMEAVLHMVGGVRSEHVLRHSWRAREQLVWLTNALFSKAFGMDRLGSKTGLPVEQIALIPRRRREGDERWNIPPEAEQMETALWQWHLEPEQGRPTHAWFAEAVAQVLRSRLEEGIVILPKGAQHHRRALPGDVAILCRTNQRCRQVADALHRAGLEAAIARTGLLDTAEARLVIACLHVLVHPDDARAIAEILVLTGAHSLETLIEARLRWKESGRTDRWGAHYDIIRQLDELRAHIAELDSAEVLTYLFDQLDLRRVVLGWGKAEQRLANLEQLMAMAVEYETRCNRLHAAASLGGFLLWLAQKQQRQEDWQAAIASPRAVNVLTYHAAKGLEWPIVVCMDLDQPLRASLWGLTIVGGQDQLDVADILVGRWLRYWVQPYGKMWRHTPLGQRVLKQEVYRNAVQRALTEEARLLYVGITRARDYLVWPTRNRPNTTAWLNRVYLGPEHETATLLDPQDHKTPWQWEGHTVFKETLVRQLPATFDSLPPIQSDPLQWIEQPIGRKSWPSAHVQPTEVDKTAWKPDVIRYANYLEAAKEQDVRAIVAFLRADEPHRNRAQREAMVQALLDRFRAVQLDTMQVVHRADRMWATLGWKIETLSWHPLWPLRGTVRSQSNGHIARLFESTLDLLAHDAHRCFVLQHVDLHTHSAEAVWRAVGGWAILTRQVLQVHFPSHTLEIYLHSPVAGVLLRL